MPIVKNSGSGRKTLKHINVVLPILQHYHCLSLCRPREDCGWLLCWFRQSTKVILLNRNDIEDMSKSAKKIPCNCIRLRRKGNGDSKNRWNVLIVCSLTDDELSGHVLYHWSNFDHSFSKLIVDFKMVKLNGNSNSRRVSQLKLFRERIFSGLILRTFWRWYCSCWIERYRFWIRLALMKTTLASPSLDMSDLVWIGQR